MKPRLILVCAVILLANILPTTAKPNVEGDGVTNDDEVPTVAGEVGPIALAPSVDDEPAVGEKPLEGTDVGDTTTTGSPPEEAETTEAETEPTAEETTTEEEFSFFAIWGGSDDGDEKPRGEEETTKTEEPTSTEAANTTSLAQQRKLSDQIREVINNYREYGSVTIPDANLPDPLSVPDVKKDFGGNPMSFTNIKAYGLSNFTVEHINTDLEKLQLYVALNIPRLVILGNYSVKSWFKKASGPFNVTLINVEASGSAELARDEEGNLQATDSVMDMTFRDARVDFKNLGMMGALLQGVLASAGPFLFDAIKPAILDEVNTKIRTEINTKIRRLGNTLSMAGDDKPLDKAVAEGRKYVRENGYDPYHLNDYVIEKGPLKGNLSEFWLRGLSRFYRVGDVSLSMDDGVIQMGMHLATMKLYGSCKWTVMVGERFKREGDTKFAVEHFQIRVLVNQSLDVKQHPVLHDLDLNVGKPIIQMDRTGRFDFLIEFLINSLPDLLRHIIVDALEEPIKFKVQKLLDDVDIEEFVEKRLPELDDMGL